MSSADSPESPAVVEEVKKDDKQENSVYGVPPEKRAWIEQALAEYDRRRCLARVVEMESEDAVPAGQNYVSDIYRLRLKTMSTGGQFSHRSVVYKILPKTKDKVPAKELGLFKVEARLYLEVFPEMEKLLKSDSPDESNLWPEFYGLMGNYEGFLLEDLKPYGYKMADRVEMLDFEHCSIALRELAKFHALGAVLLETGNISERDCLPTCFFFRTDSKEDFQKLFLIDLGNLAIKWQGEWVELGERLKKRAETSTKDVMKLLERERDGFETLNHGDYWTNNILFRYDQSGSPVSIRILDFQLVYINSPIFDILYFLSTSPRYDVLPRKLELLEIYHKSLEKNLKRFGYSKTIPTFEDLKEKYDRSRAFGQAMAHSMRVFMTSPPIKEQQEKHKDLQFEEPWKVIFLYEEEEFIKCLKYTIKESEDVGFI